MKVRFLPVLVLAFGAMGMALGQSKIYGGLNPGFNETRTGGYYSINVDGTGYVEKEFYPFNVDGSIPLGEIFAASDGRLYGTTEQGGNFSKGVLYSFKVDGTDFKVVHHFGSIAGDGNNPNGKLVQLPTGELVGTTWIGGASGRGTIFKVKPDGTAYQVLWTFADATSGGLPYGGITLASNGKLYGTVSAGGNGNAGGVFTINTNGTGFSLIQKFDANGGVPIAGLVEASDGFLYGTTSLDETSSPKQGSIFRIKLDGTGYSVVHLFAASEGKYPQSDLIEGSDGYLYGSCFGDAAVNVVYKMKKDGSDFTVLHSFPGGINLIGIDLVQAPDGLLYGMSGSYLYRLKADGTAFETLATFDAAGSLPNAALTLVNGTFYGTFVKGGKQQNGLIFSFKPSEGIKTLFDFGVNTDHGYFLSGGLTQTKSGKLLGSSQTGGATNKGFLYGMDQSLTMTELLNYPVMESIGTYLGDLVQVPDNTLVGAFQGDGTQNEFLFSIKEDGTGLKRIFDFEPTSTTGGSPNPLMMAADGFLYGTTNWGGANDVGVLYKIKPDGTGFTKLHAFNTDNEGGVPGEVMLASNGYLYGSTGQYGQYDFGTLYRIKPDGTGFQVLMQFSTISGAGYAFRERNGVLYNAASSGGADGWGAIFKINLDGSGFAVLHDFSKSDGAIPQGGIVMDDAGWIFGTTHDYGPNNHGTLFTLKSDGTGFKVLHSFQQGNPVYDLLLIQGDDTRQSQVIQFDPLSDKLTGDEPFELTATASSGLPVTFTSDNTDVATISGNMVTIQGAGTAMITASQEGSAEYAPASVQQSFTVNLITATENDPRVSSLLVAYPNPFKGIVDLRYRDGAKSRESITVQVLSSTGNVSRVITPEQISNDRIRLDLTDLATGFYILKIVGTPLQVKVVKQ